MSRRIACFVLVAVVLAGTTERAGAADLLVNGNFDGLPTGTGWVQNSNPMYPPITNGASAGIPPQSGAYIAWLGGLDGETNEIYQTVSVPAGTTQLTLNGYSLVQTSEVGGSQYDVCRAELLTTANVLLETLRTWNNVNPTATWTPFSVQASGNYAGTTIRFRIRATCDATNYTNFLFDTCKLDALTPVGVTPTRPAISQLLPAGPNPTRAGAHWRLDLTASGVVNASVYDLGGRMVRRIAHQSLSAGSHDLSWDGTDLEGRRVASGVYVCLADVDGTRFTQRVALIR